MPTRWEVERAVFRSNLEAPGRHVMLSLLALTDFETAVIPDKHTPSLSTLAAATGLNRATVARHLSELEKAGWVKRTPPDPAKAWAEKARTLYALAIGALTYVGAEAKAEAKKARRGVRLVAEDDHSDRDNTSQSGNGGDWSRSATSRRESHGLVAENSTTSRTVRHKTDPSPTAHLQPSAGANESRQAELVDLPKPTTPETEGQRVNRLARTYTDQVRMSNFNAIAGAVKKGVRSDFTDEQITAGLQVLIDEDRAVTTDSLRIAIKRLSQDAKPNGRKGTVPDIPRDDSEYDTEIG